MQMQPSLGVSIVVHRSDPQRLRATLLGLARASEELRRHGGGSVRVTLLDNGTAEGEATELRFSPREQAVFDAFERLVAERNLGFGQGHNRALRSAASEFLLVLNPDVEMAPDALRAGMDHLREHPEASGVVPQGCSAGGDPLYLAKREPSLGVLALRALRVRPSGSRWRRALARYEMHDVVERGVPAPVPLASGCFMLLRRSAFVAAGGFSSDYFLYFEDFDLSRRLAVLGPLVYLPAMRITHHGGGASLKGARHVALFCRSAFRYFSTWGWRLI